MDCQSSQWQSLANVGSWADSRTIGAGVNQLSHTPIRAILRTIPVRGHGCHFHTAVNTRGKTLYLREHGQDRSVLGGPLRFELVGKQAHALPRCIVFGRWSRHAVRADATHWCVASPTVLCDGVRSPRPASDAAGETRKLSWNVHQNFIARAIGASPGSSLPPAPAIGRRDLSVCMSTSNRPGLMTDPWATR